MRRYFSALLLIVGLVSGSFVVQALPTQSIGTWAPAGTLPGAPSGASVVTLADGRTLVIGGVLPDDTTTSAVMLYDANLNALGAVGQLAAARSGHAAAVLKDGRVIVVGGVVNGTTSADIEIFDPAAGQSAVVATLTTGRSQHAVAALLDGTVLIVGGANGAGTPLAGAEIFNPIDGSTTTAPAANSMSTARKGLTATTLLDGRVLIVGGNNGSDLASAELYYAESQTFDPAATSLSGTRSGHSAVLLRHNGGVLIAGGSSDSAAQVATDLFLPPIFPDPFSYGDGSFVATGNMGEARVGAAAGNAVEGYAFAAGGGAQSAEVYRFATVKTDKDDYMPGEAALITGTGWAPNSTVTLLFQEDPPVHPDYTRVNVPTDGDGNFSVDDWAPEQHDLGVRFYLTVSDGISRAQTTFTDGNMTVNGVVIDSVTTLPIAGVTVECIVVAGGCNNPASTTTSTTGTYSFKPDYPGGAGGSVQVRASKTGYVSQTITATTAANGQTITVNFSLVPSDTTAPTSTIQCNGAACASTFYNANVLVTLAATDNAGGSGVKEIRYTTDGSNPTTASTLYAGAFLVTATTTVKFRAEDNAGNVEAVRSQAINIDKVAPTSAIQCNVATCASTFYTVDVSVTLAATDNAGGSGVKEIRYTTDGSNPTTASTLYTGAFLVSATTTVKFRAEDHAGNVETVQSQEIKIDKVAPTSTIQCNGTTCASTFYNVDVSVTLAATDNAGGSGVKEIRYTTDGSNPTTASTLYSSAFVVTATTTVKFRAEDHAGNVEAVQSQEIKIDKVAPTSSIQCNGAACASTFYNVDVSVTLAATDNAGGSGVKEIRYTTDGSNPTTASTLYSSAFLVTATTTVKFRAEDHAGNVETVQSQEIKIDKVAPTSTIQCNGAACASAYYLIDVSVALAATDNAGGSGVKEIRYTTDGSNPTAASTLYSAAFLVTATTTVKFRAEDHAGNIESTKSQTILIDKIDPTVAITSPHGLNTIATSIAVSGTADDVPSGIASVTVNTVATSYIPATKTWSTNSNVPLNCGANTLTATATDVAGRTATHAITVTRLCFAFQYLSPLDQSFEGGPVIRNDGKYGRVIPVKGVVSLGGATQTEVDLAAFGLTLRIGVNGVACGGGNATDSLEEYADAGQSSGGTNLFRWTLDQHWIYNLDTKAPPNITMAINQCYRLDAYVQDASGTRVKISNSPYVIFRPVK